MRTTEKRILDAGDLSGNVTSEPFDTYYLTGFSFAFQWSGDPVGKIRLEATNREYKDIQNAFWLYIPDSEFILSGTPGKFELNVSLVQFRHVRFVYERTSGSGQLSAEFIGKGIS